jgi:hypothetical protein
MTFDYAFYKDLTWSPNGEYIAATRCPVMKYEPKCLGNEETILLNPKLEAINSIDFQPMTSNWVSSYPTTWSFEGDRLLIYFRESSDSNPKPLSELRKGHVSYTPDTDTFEEIDLIWKVIAWSKDVSELLITQAIDDTTIALGWYSIGTKVFREEIRYPLNGRLLGPFAFSPNSQLLLQSDSSNPTSCNEIQAYTLGSYEPFKPFLTLACFPSWSHDGNRLAYTSKFDLKGLPNRLVIANKDGSNPTSIFDETTPSPLAYPTWSPDGSQIAITMGANANAIYIVDVPPEFQPKSSVGAD